MLSISYNLISQVHQEAADITHPGQDVCTDGLVLLDSGLNLGQVAAIARITQHLNHLLQVTLAKDTLLVPGITFIRMLVYNEVITKFIFLDQFSLIHPLFLTIIMISLEEGAHG